MKHSVVSVVEFSIALIYTLQVLLFAAWVCIIKYFADMKLLVRIGRDSQPEDSKADLFKGVAILSWVMAILMTLTSVLSFDKLCSRSSPWTLTVSHDT